jgi:hypothetical protein
MAIAQFEGTELDKHGPTVAWRKNIEAKIEEKTSNASSSTTKFTWSHQGLKTKLRG